jgi:hypothetical protein
LAALIWGVNATGSAQTCDSEGEALKRASEGIPEPTVLAIGRKSDTNQRISIWRPNDSGVFDQEFSAGEEWGSDNYATDVAWGDLDADGFFELAYARKSDTNFRARLIDDVVRGYAAIDEFGDGWGEDNYATAVAFGDMDGDGINEFALARRTEDNQRVTVLRRAANGTYESLFTLGSSWGEDNYATDVAFGDMDGDGLDELAVARKTDVNARVFVVRLEGGASTTVFEVGAGWGEDNYATSVDFGDFNGDGKDELAVGRSTDQNARVFVWKLGPDGDASTVFETGASWGSSAGATCVPGGALFDSTQSR